MSNYQIELFHSLLNEFLQGESALLTIDGEVLAVRGSEPTTYGTLTTAGNTVRQYLKLQEGDIAILNDPYSGGTLLSEITFVMAVSEDLLWVNRRSLDKTVKIIKSVEEEGLRIPPTPLRQKNQINEMILSAMQAHPACPPNFVDWLKEQTLELTRQGQKLVDVLEFSGFNVTGELIEEYIELSQKTAVQKINERASGEARVDVVLDSGELLRLNLEIQDGRIAVDFGGTCPSKNIALTDSAVFGACFYSLSHFYGFDTIANSGSFSILHITKPAGCWLIAKYPAPTYKGMTCGVAAIQTAMELALKQIHLKNETGISSHCPLNFEISYKNTHTVLSLPGGFGANAGEHGAYAQTKSVSIEQLERDFPIKVLRVDHRPFPEGVAKYKGGHGLEFKIEIRDDITATWMSDLTVNPPRLPKNRSHGMPSEISLGQQDTQKKLKIQGQQKFSQGEVITLLSATGGGYGKE